VSWWSSD